MKMMMNRIAALLAAAMACAATAAAEAKTAETADGDILRYVNPFIGTNGMGHTYPGATTPFGWVQLSPDTDTVPHNVAGKYCPEAYAYCAGYRYGDSTIVGFSHTHMSGTGHSDLGDILLMPAVGEIRLNPGTADRPESGYRSRFSHNSEKASPGSYEVMLDDYGIRAELTATPRCGIHRYTYPQGSRGHLVMDLSHGIYNYEGKTLWAYVRVENDTLLTGYRITEGWARTNYTYFAVSFSKPVTTYGYRESEKPLYSGFWRRFETRKDFPEMAGRGLSAYFCFDTSDGEPLVVKVALSATGRQGALTNLAAEASGRSFEQLKEQARGMWDKELGIFSIEGSEDQKTMFYTSLYHTMLNPSLYMDADGKYRGLDHDIHQAPEGVANYTVFSLWDTYRAEHPLLDLICPGRSSDMAASMVAHAGQSVHGMLPVWSHMGNENWCMSGYHAVPVLCDALVTGAYRDTAAALEAMKRTSTVPYYEGLDEYMELGYVPLERSATAASTTLEYAFDDWCIYRTACLASDTLTARQYLKRALNYRNIFDTESGFARPKYRDGRFKEDFDPMQTHGEGFIEGNSWNFTFHVPHDVYGMMALTGGERRFTERLDSLFAMHLPQEYFTKNEDITESCLVGGYVHGNEPSHHVPYLYAWTSQPWKGQYWLREIMNRMYRNDIDGLGGNDDCGQMSAWYVFSVMGFYPVCPGSGEYVLGAPYLPYVRLSLPGGRTLEIKAPGASDRKRYIKSVKLNGKPYDKLYITHEDISRGGVLEFEMSSKPERRRGLGAECKPYSLTGPESGDVQGM